MVDLHNKIFNYIWENEKTPMDFSKMVASPIHNKGDRLTEGYIPSDISISHTWKNLSKDGGKSENQIQ